MNKIYIWGAGIYLKYIYPAIDRSVWTIEGIIDSNTDKQGQLWHGEIMIYSPQRLESQEFDYIIISPLAYEEIEKECRKLNIPENKVISYWKDPRNLGIFENWIERIVREYQEKATLKKKLRNTQNKLENTINRLNSAQTNLEIFQNRLESAPYEWGLKPVPKIKSGEELLKKIISDRSSLSRFGDGEFEIMCGRERPWFQNVAESLSSRLIEVIRSDNPALNIAIAQNFTGLEKYKDTSADIIRQYLANDTRDDIISFLDPGKEYYDAYVSRPYIMYKNSENAKIIFPLFQRIWKERNVILVEGKYTRTGIGNDLLSTAKSIRRIICPPKNAWDYYDAILGEVEKIAHEDDLVCISLGPTATVLAYDLASKGLQALDIGQLDNEYEWYIRNAESRVPIPGKMVSETSNNSGLEEFDSAEYRSQIVCEIGCNLPKRLCIYVTYNKEQKMEEYVGYMLKSLKACCRTLCVVCNYSELRGGEEYLNLYSDAVLYRDNIGYDAGAYKDMLCNVLGWDAIDKYDELILINDSFFGPFYDMNQCFSLMQNIGCDFWGMTRSSSGKTKLNGTIYKYKPHVQSYFLVFRKRVLHSDLFRHFWEDMSYPRTYSDAILNYELKINEFLNDNDFASSALTDVWGMSFGDDINPSFTYPLELIRKGIPVLKKKSLTVTNPSFISVLKAVEYLETNRLYPTGLIWEKIDRQFYIEKQPAPLGMCCLEQFYKEFSKVYIYGVDTLSKNLASYFEYKGWRYEGIVISGKSGQNIECIPFDDIEIDDETGIVIPVLDKLRANQIFIYLGTRCKEKQLFTICDCIAATMVS